MEQQLTAQEEIEKLVLAHAKELVLAGDHKRAAEIMTEYKRSLLPDTHPSKNLSAAGVLIGEEVSQMSAFDSDTRATEEQMAFMSAITAGGASYDMAVANMKILGKFLMWEQPHVLVAATEYLRSQKEAEGITTGDSRSID